MLIFMGSFQRRARALTIGLAISFGVAHAAEIEIRSKDGERTIQGELVDVVSFSPAVVAVRRAEKTIELPLTEVDESDRTRLSAWLEAVQQDPHHRWLRKTANQAELSVLFVGNSYTFKLPEMLAKLAAANGKKLVTKERTKGGWTLAAHAKDTRTPKLVRSQPWDLVVLQEQSQIPAILELRSSEMLPALQTLTEQASENGPAFALYQTWGRQQGDPAGDHGAGDSYEAMQRHLIEGYQEIAEALDLPVARAGEAWQREIADGRGEQLFVEDGSHPTARGVYLNACVFYCFLFNEPIQHGLKRSDLGDHLEALQQNAYLAGCWQKPELAPSISSAE